MATDAEELRKKRFQWGRCCFCGKANWYSEPVVVPALRLSAERMAELDRLYDRSAASAS